MPARPAAFSDWVKTAIAKQAAAVAATGWDETTQVRFVRLLLGQGLDELEAAENEYHDFLADCVFLASENMQDARLQILEHRVGALENPPFSLAETLLDGALIMAGEVIVAAAAYYAVPALFALVSSRQIARLSGEVLERSSAVTGVVKEIADAEALIKGNLTETGGLLRQLRAVGADKDQYALGLTLQESVAALRRDSALQREKLAVARAALATGQAAAKRAVEAFESAKSATDVASESLRKLLHQPALETSIGRVGETVGQDISAVAMDLLGGSTSEPFLPFETSGIAGEFLSAIRDERRASRRQWSDLRLQLDFVADADFLASALVADLQAMVASNQYLTTTVTGFSSEERGVFVLAFESLLWRHWFAYSNLLQVVPFADVKFYVQFPFSEGDVVDGYVIERSVIGGLGFNVAEGLFYPGAPSIDEELARVLFDKFAKPFYLRHPDAVPAPVRALDSNGQFDAARYTTLWKLPEANPIGLANQDRIHRLDEVRVLIIAYFIRSEQSAASDGDGFGAEAIRKALRTMLGLPEQPVPGLGPLQEIIDGMPVFETPAPAVSQGAPQDLAEFATALATAGGLEQKWLTGDARARLEAAVGNLDQKISAYALATARGPALTTAESDVLDSALEAIEPAQQEVTARQAEFVELAAAQPTLIAEVDAQWGERIRVLTGWTPEQANEGSWRWYAPAMPPAPPPNT